MTFKERILNREFITGALTAGFGAWMLVGLNKRFGVYPKAIFIAMIVIGALMLLTTLLYPAARRTPLDRVSFYEAAFIAIMIASPAAIGFLGFYAASFLIILAIALLPLPEYSVRTVGKTAAYVLAITIVTYLVFSALLKIKVPTGVFF